MLKIKEFFEKYKYGILCGIIIIILAVIKQCLMINIPILAYVSAGEDDALMIKFAMNILQGNWLGDYAYDTLMKGPIFPLILAFMNKMNLSYIFTMTCFYSISCIIFMISIRKLVKNKIAFLLIYTILLFNPIMFSKNIIQRVYRNALIPSFSLLIIGGYIGLFLRRNEKIRFWIPWIILESIILPLFYYTREDSIWIIPFLIFIIASTIIGIIIKERKIKLDLICKIILFIIPFICLTLLGNWIASQNEKYYGLRTKNVMTESNFGPAIEAIFAVKPNVYIDCVTVPIEKIDRMAKVSESFASITPALKQTVVSYNKWDRNPDDGEIEDGWFTWALKSAAVDSGYTTFSEEQVLYARICEDLNKAMSEGLLERQALVPFAKTSSWRSKYTWPFIKSIGQITKFIATFEDISISNTEVSTDNPELFDVVKNFENISGDRAIYPNNVENSNGQDEFIKSSNIQINICNALIKIYSYLGVITLILGIISYIILTIFMIKNILKKNFDLVQNWIVVSAILGAIFTLILGIAYTHTTTVYSIVYLYLCAVYPLYFAFSCLSIKSIYEKINKTVKC